MADLIKEQEVLSQEQKKSKKLLYKNWKIYASALGIVVIGTGVGLGIYYGVTANQKGSNTVSSQTIVDEINSKSYTHSTLKNSTVTEFKATFADFFKQGLSEDASAAFDAKLFSIGTIVVDDIEPYVTPGEHELTDADLATVGIINTKIGYTYDSIKGNDLHFTITVNLNDTDKKVINAITNATYGVSTVAGNNTESIITQITPELIKEGININLRESFDEKAFDAKTIKVMNGDKALSEEDLAKMTETPLVTTLTFTYIGQEVKTSLNITVTATNEQVINAISEHTYSLETKIESEAWAVTNGLTASVIEDGIENEQVKTAFDAELFDGKSVKVKIGDNELTKDDLSKATGETPLATTLTFTYAEQEVTTNLNITVTPYTNEDVINTIKEHNYSLDTKVGGEPGIVIDMITADFIKEGLNLESKPKLKEAFDAKAFVGESVKVMNGDKALSEKDLAEATGETPLATTLTFTYAEQEVTTKLNITVTPYTNEDVINTIKEHNYSLDTIAGAKPDSVIEMITADFIKNGIEKEEIKNAFDAEAFVGDTVKIMIDGEELSEEDLAKATTAEGKPLETTVTFTYAGEKVTTNLNITVNAEK